MNEKEFRQWLEAQPQRTPGGLDDRIMARVRRATSPIERAEQRAERRLLVWSIVLGAVVLGIGIAALSFFVDRESLPEVQIPEISFALPAILTDPQAWVWTKSLLPFVGIVWILLVGDFLLRRRFLKH